VVETGSVAKQEEGLVPLFFVWPERDGGI